MAIEYRLELSDLSGKCGLSEQDDLNQIDSPEPLPWPNVGDVVAFADEPLGVVKHRTFNVSKIGGVLRFTVSARCERIT